MEVRRWKGTGLSEGDSINERFVSIGQQARERATSIRNPADGGGFREPPLAARDRLHGSTTLFLLPGDLTRITYARKIDFLRACLRLRARNYASRAHVLRLNPKRSQMLGSLRPAERPPRGNGIPRRWGYVSARGCARDTKATKHHVGNQLMNQSRLNRLDARSRSPL